MVMRQRNLHNTRKQENTIRKTKQNKELENMQKE